MRVLTLPLVALVASCGAPQSFAQPREAVEIAGRVAGPPVHCLPTVSSQTFGISESDRSTLVYRNGSTVWVNRLGPSCSFAWNDIPVFEMTGSSYCRGDLVHSIDRSSHIAGPSCVLNDFVPYIKL